ncbi:response regulator [Candidatus Dojkabacteria bacterium]|uniref:Response regulator n=1 Tax=Candidatus Dojkabacteria bacterium TaxID=2099670 RepID=A0A955I925_9BACT|nr:response regulator [Candidatus Dojkabacteria bacterium]
MAETDSTTSEDKKRILIAEDEKAIISVLSIKLESSGFIVDKAMNGKEALELLQKNEYDLVLLDLIMPIVNGFEVLEYVKENNIDAKIIVTSNLGQEEDVKKAEGLGALDYFVKSDMTLSQIVEGIKKYQ